MTTDKVLLIEDDATMLSLLRTLLQIEGYNAVQLDQVDNLDEILTGVREEQPGLILLDVHLRKLNGFDLLRMIRQDDELKETRVIMSSGMDFSERCLEAGADDFILKPYMPEDLLEMIRQVISE